MRAIETVMDMKENGEFLLHFPNGVKPGRYRVVVVVEDELIDEDELTSEIDTAYKAEIDRRLMEMEKNPGKGFTMQDVLNELEEDLGRKIQTRTVR